MNDYEYIEALENALIFMCGWYDDLHEDVFQDYINKVNDKYYKLSTIQGTMNRFALKDIVRIGFNSSPKHGFPQIAEEMKKRSENK
ncbi:hypothetical protein PP175_28470 (plasmid) [Aneurinibacillus sp. Ricciae_BoGa-3]|uniref:hypothetical protein n=1 Tax=Aneurinibacillus sp. Ricciae_BoGa-3 TaxID=3022697 RepID=UPI002341A301|nr:hypothetical protein [Aneurinibacillus sp. Ricciae_BoGa-3]WCK57127.1 hypothetical protein PP175_28470 [Aneurinibacillus sp. Ricciae_BoGa-3]